jgi:hypothetical protein
MARSVRTLQPKVRGRACRWSSYPGTTRLGKHEALPLHDVEVV